jgi:putative ABC transport system permease protein
MRILLKLAFRNVFRFKRRTFITFSAVSLGLAILIISLSLMNGIDKQSIYNIVNSQISHLKLFNKGYYDKKNDLPMHITIHEPEAIQRLLMESPMVKESESRIQFAAGLIKGMDELPCVGVAIQPRRNPRLFNIKQSMIDGEWLEPDDNKVLLGKDLAEDIGISVGDSLTIRLVLSSLEEDFIWNAIDVEVKGIYETGNPTIDSGYLLIPLQAAQSGLSMKNQVTEIAVRLTLDSTDIKGLERELINISALLEAEQPDIEAYSWKELAGTFLAVSEMKTRNSSIIIMIMLFIASMGIVNTMLMAVFERTREIGMMRAMGMKKREIQILFMMEGGLIGIMGSILACILGGLGSWYLEVKGLNFSMMDETMQKFSSAVYPVKDTFYADLTFEVLVLTFILGTAVSIIASYYPARRAAKMSPVKALRHI